jgi:ABC-type sugar transport system, periplasmic component
MKKIEFMLAVLLLTSVVITACGDKNGTVKTSETDTGTGTGTVSQSETDAPNPYVQDDGLPEADLDGRTFTFLTATDITGGELTVMDSELTGDSLIDTIHYRTQYVEERYNVDITDLRRSYNDTYTVISKAVLAQDNSFNACYGFIPYMFQLATEGSLTEFTQIPYINLEKPWWDQNAKGAFSVANRLYYMVGDANMFYNDYTWVMYFNKQLMTDLAGSDPYELVNNGTWTLDAMYTMGVKAVKDLNSDGEMTPGTDRYGMVTHSPTREAMIYGGGELMFAKDSDDLPVMTMDNERFYSLCDKIGKIFTQENFMEDLTGTNTGDSIQTNFMNGNALFAGEVLQCARRYRAMETDFGILPYPKFDEAQSNYVSYSLWAVSPVGVPSYMSDGDLETAGLIIEALQSASHSSLVSAYFDAALTSSKFLRDEQSDDMLKIIFDTRCYPLATMRDFGGVVAIITTNIAKNKSNYTSVVAGYKSKVEKDIEEIVDKIQNLP